jgi:hypothetical protein
MTAKKITDQVKGGFVLQKVYECTSVCSLEGGLRTFCGLPAAASAGMDPLILVFVWQLANERKRLETVEKWGADLLSLNFCRG